jgi:hypothetical protein
MKDASQARTLLAGGIAGIMALVGAALLFGRAMRSRISGKSGDGTRLGRTGSSMRDPRVTPLPTGVARVLTESGAVSAQQLAEMSPTEREFFVATVAAQMGKTGKPRLVPGGAGPATRGGAAAAPSAEPAAALDPISSSTLVSGPIHCPVCRTPIGERTVTPLLMSKCPGCGRRVSARVEGDRLTVTVNYGKGTPVLGTTAIRPN